MSVLGCDRPLPEDIPIIGGCWTDMGYAKWSGSCPLGKAEGEGTATFQTGGAETVTGQFDAGVPVGEVKVSFGSGATYVGGLRDGEPHGQGVWMESWGEGYEGGWQEGYQHGEGAFISPDGKRIPGLWERSNLIGSWYEDAKTGCRVWFAVLDDPVGELSWTGSCVEGLAKGNGTIRWQQSVENSLVHEVTFSGTLREGKLHGIGRWEQVDRYTNVVDRTVKTGTWLDGQRSGIGADGEVSEFLDGAFAGATSGYAGSWKGGKRYGQGHRYETKKHIGGRTETKTEIGQFRNGGFSEGRMVREDREGDSARITFEQGRFEGQFTGYGTVIEMLENRSTGYSSSRVVRYEGSHHQDGEGVVHLGGEDVFVGRVAGFGPQGHGGEFRDGFCSLKSIGFVGTCKTASFDTGDYSGKSCIVARNRPDRCLKEISWWVS
ncbi:hypothetical protein [uncultured Erythrobacter sp.]|uniref:hypothetical protein n=1 Tax=uncultured Erythrobacter sp. TaxID=263913 RepID=UPI00261CEE4D|nr:hypothetical protein [uncultured Erythrobacter sp.]